LDSGVTFCGAPLATPFANIAASNIAVIVNVDFKGIVSGSNLLDYAGVARGLLFEREDQYCYRLGCI
jgi:hypothetical protein